MIKNPADGKTKIPSAGQTVKEPQIRADSLRTGKSLAEFAATVGGEYNQICFSPRHVRGEKHLSACNCASAASAGSRPQPSQKSPWTFLTRRESAGTNTPRRIQTVKKLWLRKTCMALQKCLAEFAATVGGE